jgi:hypothetical protein
MLVTIEPNAVPTAKHRRELGAIQGFTLDDVLVVRQNDFSSDAI